MVFKGFLVVLLISVIFNDKAYAYIDPSSGSVLFQVIIAGLVGGLYAIKVYFRKITAFFKSRFFDKLKND